MWRYDSQGGYRRVLTRFFALFEFQDAAVGDGEAEDLASQTEGRR